MILISSKGYALAQYHLGQIFRKKLDYSKAVRFFQMATVQGHDGGQHGLAECLEEGLGIEKNTSDAFQLYKAAAGSFSGIIFVYFDHFFSVDQDYTPALYKLGRLLHSKV